MTCRVTTAISVHILLYMTGAIEMHCLLKSILLGTTNSNKSSLDSKDFQTLFKYIKNLNTLKFEVACKRYE